MRKIKYETIHNICPDCERIFCEQHYSITQEGQCPDCRGTVMGEDEFHPLVIKLKDRISFTKAQRKELNL